MNSGEDHLGIDLIGTDPTGTDPTGTDLTGTEDGDSIDSLPQYIIGKFSYYIFFYFIFHAV